MLITKNPPEWADFFVLRIGMLDDLGEYLWLGVSDFREYLAVELDLLYVEEINELAVGSAVFFCGCSYALLPESAILSFLHLAAFICVAPCMQECLMRHSLF